MRLSVKYSELLKQFLAVIIVMLGITLLYLLIMFFLRFVNVSETILTIYTVAGSILVAVASVFVLRKYILVEAEAEYDSNGIHFLFRNYSSLYKTNAVSVMYDDIQKIIFDETESYKVYVKLKIKSPNKTILISPGKYADHAAFISYWSEVKQKIQQKKKAQIHEG